MAVNWGIGAIAYVFTGRAKGAGGTAVGARADYIAWVGSKGDSGLTGITDSICLRCTGINCLIGAAVRGGDTGLLYWIVST